MMMVLVMMMMMLNVMAPKLTILATLLMTVIGNYGVTSNVGSRHISDGG